MLDLIPLAMVSVLYLLVPLAFAAFGLYTLHRMRLALERIERRMS